MAELNVKRESLAQRCEICHQSDVFDPIKNVCSRCKKIQYSENSENQDRATRRDFLFACRNQIKLAIDRLESLETTKSRFFQSNVDYEKPQTLEWDKSRLKWFTIASSGVTVFVHIIIELFYVTYHITPEEHSPWWLRLIFAVCLFSTITLGTLTFPRWYSILAFLSLVFIVLSVGGR